MGRGRDRRQAVLRGQLADGGAEMAQLRRAPRPAIVQMPVPTSICERRNSGVTRSPSAAFAASNSSGGGSTGQVAGLAVDQQILFLDAEGEGGLLHHGALARANLMQRGDCR